MKPAAPRAKKAKAGEPRPQPSELLKALARAYHYAALNLPEDQLTEAGRAYRAQAQAEWQARQTPPAEQPTTANGATPPPEHHEEEHAAAA